MKRSYQLISTFLLLFCLCACNQKPTLHDEVLSLKIEWGFEFPLPSENDSINLLYIRMEKSYFNLEFEKMDSLAKRILSIDSTFYKALSFQAFGQWPFDLEKLEIAKKFAGQDTSIHRLIFGGDYSYWIKHDTVSALEQYTEVYNQYPNSKIAAWLAGMASLWSKDYEMAVTYYKRALEIDSTFYHSYYDIGDAYYGNNDYSNAIINFKQFLIHHPENITINQALGDIYLSLNDSLIAKKYHQNADSLRNVPRKN
jgi:tetratricopeptide (TPR) repeat protein